MTTNSGKFSAENDLQNTTSMSYFWVINSSLNGIISEGYFFYFISEEETRERLLKTVKKEVCVISSLTAV